MTHLATRISKHQKNGETGRLLSTSMEMSASWLEQLGKCVSRHDFLWRVLRTQLQPAALTEAATLDYILAFCPSCGPYWNQTASIGFPSGESKDFAE